MLETIITFIVNIIVWGILGLSAIILVVATYYDIKDKIERKNFSNSLRWWCSSCGRLELQIPIELAETAHHSGACDDDVLAISKDEWVRDFTTAWNPDIVVNVLREYGAWEDEELKDRQQNIQRMLWIACCDIAEQEFEANNPGF